MRTRAQGGDLGGAWVTRSLAECTEVRKQSFLLFFFLFSFLIIKAVAGELGSSCPTSVPPNGTQGAPCCLQGPHSLPCSGPGQAPSVISHSRL